MKFVSFMVGALVVAGGAQATPAEDTFNKDVAEAKATVERVAVQLAAAALPGADARIVGAGLRAPASNGHDYQAGWAKGFADSRAGKSGGAGETGEYAEGYRAGWQVGSQPLY